MLPTQSAQLIKVPAPILTVFEDSDTVKQFEAILHAGTNAFVKSALITIAASPDLMSCTPNSLANGTLRSAALGLSLDPALRQAYLVPRPTKKGVMQACFQPHYSGLYDLAVRTNKYRFISVSPIYVGETVLENVQTGIHVYVREGSNTLLAANPGVDGLHPGFRDVTNGKNTAKVRGYLGYFKTMKGFEKSVWMTLEEIQAHAILWSPASYKSEKGAWQDPKKRPIMEMKTVFIALSKFMDLSGEDNSKLRGAIDDAVSLEEDATPAEYLEGVVSTEEAQSANAQDAQSENVNQDTGELSAPIELIDPMGEWAVNYAMKTWNIDQKATCTAIASKKLGKRMEKKDFVALVTGAQS
jgi:recombination protein RecT